MELVQGYAGQSLYDYADNGNADPPASDDRWKLNQALSAMYQKALNYLTVQAGKEYKAMKEAEKKGVTNVSLQNRRFNICIYVL